MDLCERQRKRRNEVSVTSTSLNTPDTNSSFDELLEHYRAMNAIPDSLVHLAPKEARAECRRLEHHLQVMEAYSPRPIGIPVHLFVATERFLQRTPSSPSLGWERCVPEHLLHVHSVPGDHHSMLRPPHIKILGQQLTECLVTAAIVPDSLQVLHAAGSD